MTEQIENNEDFKSGFISIVGAPNAGKSTLLNKLLGEKISITSKKPQTTRNRILGIVHRSEAQLVFIDTPGVHKAKSPLNIKMVDAAMSTLGEADIILFMIDVTSKDEKSEQILIQKIKNQSLPVVLALNKIDLIKKKEIFEVIDKYKNIHNFKAILPLSAKHGTKLEELQIELINLLPKSPPLFPKETITDVPERFIVAELIREKIFRLTGQEIPYSIAVEIESFKRKKKLVTIHAIINVEKKSQKGIIIGKQGAKLKQIGIEARHDIEKLIESKVMLHLFVKVQKNWSTNARIMKEFGY